MGYSPIIASTITEFKWTERGTKLRIGPKTRWTLLIQPGITPKTNTKKPRHPDGVPSRNLTSYSSVRQSDCFASVKSGAYQELRSIAVAIEEKQSVSTPEGGLIASKSQDRPSRPLSNGKPFTGIALNSHSKTQVGRGLAQKPKPQREGCKYRRKRDQQGSPLRGRVWGYPGRTISTSKGHVFLRVLFHEMRESGFIDALLKRVPLKKR